MDGLNWLLLPKSPKYAKFLTPLAVNKFEGEPSIVTNVYDSNPPFPSNENPKQYYNVRQLDNHLSGTYFYIFIFFFFSFRDLYQRN